MVLLFFSWIYFFLLFAIFGSLVSKGINKLFNTKHLSGMFYSFFIGLLSITTLLEITSLFYRVNWEIHLIILFTCIVYSLNFREEIYDNFKKAICYLKENKLLLLSFLVFGVFILFYGTDGPVYNLDPARYHFQILNWAVNYPAVPGIANLHDRFGGMGSWHLLHAFAEVGPLKQKTYHVFNSLIFFVFICRLLGSVQKTINKKETSALVLFEIVVLIIVLCYFNFIRYWFLSSLSQDIPNIILCIICFMYYLDNKETINGKSNFHIVVLTLLCCTGFSIKLSALFLVFILIKPIVFRLIYIKQNIKVLIAIFIIAFLTFGTHMLKRTISTGWPLFPVTSINFGSFDWQYPKEKADGMSHCISHDSFAPEKDTVFKSYSGYEKKTKSEMFFIWFLREFKAFGFIFYVCCTICLHLFLYVFFRKKLQEYYCEYGYILLASILCLIFWITSAPDIRFGLGYLSAFYGISFLIFQPFLFKSRPFAKGSLIIIVFISIVSFIKSTRISLTQEKAIYPLSLAQHMLNSNNLFELVGIPKTKFIKKEVSPNLIINYPLRDTSYGKFGRNEPFYLEHFDPNKQGVDSLTKEKMANFNSSNLLNWYLPLPATNTVYDELELRTGDLRDGFRFNRTKSKKKN